MTGPGGEPEEPAPRSGERSVTRSRRALAALVFLGVFNVVLLFASSWPALYDTDSAYHVAVARLYAREGLVKDLPWARFSALGHGFGDKELLFHVLLAPFASFRDAGVGGRVALALLDGAVAAALAVVAMRQLGAWGALVPLWVFLTASDFTLRALRLRPELLALLLLLAATLAAARRRWLILGVLAFAYALSYTAIQAFLGLAVLFFLRVLLVEKRAEMRLLVAPIAGLALGLLAHPRLPANLRVFWLQNVTFYEMKGVLDVGAEIRSPAAFNILALNAGWIAGMLVLLAARRSPGDRVPVPASDERRRLADFLFVGAAAFFLLYLWAMRFVTYFVPFATLALAARVALDGGLSTRARLPWAGSVPIRLALCLPLLAVPYAFHLVSLNLMNAGVFASERRESDAALAAALPPGAKVAATWRNAEQYVLAAPQARYLNLLDPVFMAAPFPEEYEAQRALFSGEDRDPVLTAATTLDSDYVAFLRGAEHALLARRLDRDPRVTRLHAGADALANRAFVLDWRVAPKGVEAPPPRGAASSWHPYPRAGTERGRHFEGYVDARRISTSGCVAFVHLASAATPELVTYELASSGPTSLYLDGELVAAAPASDAVPGSGVTLPLRLSAGAHELTVATCPIRGANGFALVERSRASER
jgi:hypothetical protein